MTESEKEIFELKVSLGVAVTLLATVTKLPEATVIDKIATITLNQLMDGASKFDSSNKQELSSLGKKEETLKETAEAYYARMGYKSTRK